MSKTWPTKMKDLSIAHAVLEQYAQAHNTHNLSLFELSVNEVEKAFDFQISGWVRVLADIYNEEYGEEEGDRITRNVITQCLVGNHIIH